MPQKARERSSTGIYHVMIRGVNRQNIFEDDDDHQKFLDVLFENKKTRGMELYGYCLMGNHVHILLKENLQSISSIMQNLCSAYAYWYNWKYDRLGHLFQERFKSEVVEDERYLISVLRYIHQNPVKAGLVNSVRHWKWSSYNEYLNKQVNVNIEYILELFSNNRSVAVESFRKYMEESSKEIYLDYLEKHRISDDELSKLIEERYGVKKGFFHLLDRQTRDIILHNLKENNCGTIRQLARVTGLNKGNIEKA